MDVPPPPPNLPGLPPPCAQPGLQRQINVLAWDEVEAQSPNRCCALVRVIDAWVYYIYREHLEHPWRRVSEFTEGARRNLLLEFLAKQ